jgi:hypothetical protein
MCQASAMSGSGPLDKNTRRHGACRVDGSTGVSICQQGQPTLNCTTRLCHTPFASANTRHLGADLHISIDAPYTTHDAKTQCNTQHLVPRFQPSSNLTSRYSVQCGLSCRAPSIHLNNKNPMWHKMVLNIAPELG